MLNRRKLLGSDCLEACSQVMVETVELALVGLGTLCVTVDPLPKC